MKQSEMNLCPRCGSDQTTTLETPLVTSASWVTGGASVGVKRALMRCANCHIDYQQAVSLSNDAPVSVKFEYTYSEWVDDKHGGEMKEFKIETPDYPIEG